MATFDASPITVDLLLVHVDLERRAVRRRCIGCRCGQKFGEPVATEGISVSWPSLYGDQLLVRLNLSVLWPCETRRSSSLFWVACYRRFDPFGGKDRCQSRPWRPVPRVCEEVSFGSLIAKSEKQVSSTRRTVVLVWLAQSQALDRAWPVQGNQRRNFWIAVMQL